jgi:hypothetical protein
MAKQHVVLPVNSIPDAQRELERLARFLAEGLEGGTGTPGPEGPAGPPGPPGSATLPTPVKQGDIYYAANDGVTELSRLEIPVDWDTQDYLLGIRSHIPSWFAIIGGTLIHGLYPAINLYPAGNVYPEAA